VSGLITPAQAAGLIAQRCQPLGRQSVELTHALGCILARDIYAERDSPPFDRVAMDGIAVRGAELHHTRTFTLAGVVAAGHAPPATCPEGSAYEVMTGAMLPTMLDTVVPVEHLEVADGKATIKADCVVTQGQNIHRRGVDAQSGQLVLKAHSRLSAPDLAIAASANQSRLEVFKKPSVVIVTTGDELVEPGAPIEAWQIRRSNVHAIRASLIQHGIHDVADEHLADTLEPMTERLAALVNTHAMVILSGGVSAGRFDYVPKALQRAGVVPAFHKVAQRPGKPLWFGSTPSGTLVFGLPGNPVSTAVCMARYVRHALDRLQGFDATLPRRVLLNEDCQNPSTLWHFRPVGPTPNGDWQVFSTQGSGDFHALQGTWGCIEIPPHTQLTAHTPVDFYPW